MNVGRGSGGLGPSNAAAAPRAFLLIAVAVVLGLVLLWKGLDDTPGLGPVADSGEETAVAGSSAGEIEGASGTVTPTSTEVVGGDAELSPTTTVAPTTTRELFPAPTHTPNEVKVLVANGSGVSGAAGKVTDMLSPLGWAMESPANAEKASATRIYYRTGYVADAKVIVDHFGEIADVLEEMPPGGLAVPSNAEERVANADIVLILGSDLRIQSS